MKTISNICGRVGAAALGGLSFALGALARFFICGVRTLPHGRGSVGLANAVEAIKGFIGIANVYSADGGDWIQITPPLGDYPHARGIQRIDKAAVMSMANSFAGRGVPFYVGHPDVPEVEKDYPDKRAHGWITALEARADGLFGKARWSETGKEMLANSHYRFFSPYWDAEELPGGDPKYRGKKVYRPMALLSVGLTNKPNLPTNALANEEEEKAHETDETHENIFMERAALLTALGLANEANDEQIRTRLAACVAAYTSLANVQTERDSAKTALSNEQTAHTSTKGSFETQLANVRTELANERKERATLLVDAAIKDGRVPQAKREEWIGGLVTDFAGKSVALANEKGTVKTTGRTDGMGDRRANSEALANERARREKVEALMNEKQSKGMTFDAAWSVVQRENPELFEQMHQPKKD